MNPLTRTLQHFALFAGAGVGLLALLAGTITHTLRKTWTGAGNATDTGTFTVTADGEDNRSFVVPASTSNVEIDIDFVYTRLKMFYVRATGDVTLKTNSTVGSNSITVKLAGPYSWVSTDGATNPFTADVTRTYWDNAAAVDVQVELRALYDSSV